MIDPALWILSVPQSLLFSIAQMTGLREVIGFSFLLGGVLVLPLLYVALTNRPIPFIPYLTHRNSAKIAMMGMMLSAVLWFYMLKVSWNVETGLTTVVFIRQILGNMLFSGLLGVVLNSELKTEVENELKLRAVMHEDVDQQREDVGDDASSKGNSMREPGEAVKYEGNTYKVCFPLFNSSFQEKFCYDLGSSKGSQSTTHATSSFSSSHSNSSFHRTTEHRYQSSNSPSYQGFIQPPFR